MAWLDGFSNNRYPHRRIVAADIDDRSVRLVEAAATRGGLKAVAAVEADFPAELDLADAAAVGRFVAAVRERAGIAAGPGITAVAAHQAGWHMMSLPAAPDDELWPMALMQARREQHLDGMAVEFCRLPGPADGRRVLAGSVHTELLDRARKVLAEAGCPADAVGLRPLAVLRNWMVPGASAGDTVAAVVDVGRTHSEILLLSGNEVVACRSAPAGWGSDADDHGGAEPSTGAGSDAWMETLSLEIRRTIFSYSGRGGTPAAKLIRLSVGGEHAGKLSEHLRTVGGYDVECLSPAGGLEASAAVAAELQRGNYAAALGLARQYLADRDVPLDYQHPKIDEAEKQTRDRQRTRKLVMALAAVIALVLPLPFYIFEKRDLDEQTNALNDMKHRADVAKSDIEKYRMFRDRIWSDKPDGNVPEALKAAVAEERKKYQWVKGQIADLKALDSFAGKAAAARRFPALRALGEIYDVGAKVFGGENGGAKRGVLTEFRLEPSQAPGDAGRSDKADKPERARIRLAGRADTLDVVKEFVAGLNGMGGLVLEITFPQTPAGRDGAAAGLVSFELTYRPAFLSGTPEPATPAAPTPKAAATVTKGGPR